MKKRSIRILSLHAFVVIVMNLLPHIMVIHAEFLKTLRVFPQNRSFLNFNFWKKNSLLDFAYVLNDVVLQNNAVEWYRHLTLEVKLQWNEKWMK